MTRFRISGNITILPASDYCSADVPNGYLQNHYILCDELKGRDYLINETVKFYIDKFSTPKTQMEVLSEIASEIGCGTDQIEKTCSDFFSFLCKRKILLTENRVPPFASKTPLFKEGDTIDDLYITELLSNKKYLDLYIVLEKTTGRPFVIKLLNANKTSSRRIYLEQLLELKREYAMLCRAREISPVCQVHRFKNQPSQHPYLQLEYIQGSSLSKFIRDSENFTEADCFLLIDALCDAFALLHDHGLIHGDIHSSNVLVTETKTIKIIDLGMTLSTGMDKNEVVPIGGVNFCMPPERINIATFEKFSKEPDLTSDVYQIGILLYQILYATRPFSGFIWEELARNIKETPVHYPDSSHLDFHVPDELKKIIDRCLRKNSSERYSNAREIHTDFKNIKLKEAANI